MFRCLNSDLGGDMILFVLTEADFMSGDITGSLDQPWHNKRADIIVPEITLLTKLTIHR